ncbi:MAG TPA: transglutaminase-like domain-containing protein [Desulfobacterales bacterium]|nr:transglutaminase-like domain-containing protein [Desulfobacterales bacterium]
MSPSSLNALPEKDAWMNILLKDRKIGSSHTVFSKIEDGYRLEETVYMRFNTMGLTQDMILKTTGRLGSDFTLSSFNFEMGSGRFHFSAQGSVSGNVLSIKTHSSGSTKDIQISVREKIYIPSGILNAAVTSGMKTGDEFAVQVFDPVSMASEPVIIKMMGPEKIVNMGLEKNTKKMTVSYKGTTQLAWIGENGDVIREKGLLGIRLEKTTRDDALSGLQKEPILDLTEVASVPSNIRIDDPSRLKGIDIEISGVNYNTVRLQGGRQRLTDNILTIKKEDISGLPDVLDKNKMGKIEKDFLMPSPFIESDHPKIQNLVNKIVSADDRPLIKVNKLVAWLRNNIEKRPVLSLPDALATLENRVGDCNEHAVLLAALARASGIPARIEVGLVYLNGRFYYHAWNLLYVGQWITADSVLGQVPADVTHIRFSSGAIQKQLDLMGIIGQIKLKITGLTE